MRKIYNLFFIATLVSLVSCQDEVDVDNLMNFPPTVLSVTPKTGVKTGDFDIKVVFVDGVSSPLSSATVVLKDAAGNEIASGAKALTGVKDSVVIAGSEFGSADLPLGDYSIAITAADSKNNVTTSETTFKIVNQLYLANQSEMYIAGAFNGWGAGVMELVANNTWEIKNIDLAGGPWKFKNTTDWTDADWGDSNCDGTMEVTTGGGPNTECDYSGLVNVRFNDETLKYTVLPAVNYEANLGSLYLLGSFNNFQGPEPKFTLVADHTWKVAEFRMKAGDSFKFAEKTTFEGINYGDAQFDGKAEMFGPNIVLPESYADAFYEIVFNDETRAYSLTVARYPFPSNLYLVGGSTSADWSPPASIPFKKLAEGKFEIYSYLTTAGGGFKFLQVQDWAGDWGKGDEGKVVQEGEGNLTVSSDGFYRIYVDYTNMTYSVTESSWGIIGSARTGDDSGWGADDNMTFVGGKGSYKWTISKTLFNGKLKFRMNDSWDINLGDNEPNGTLEYGGKDIDITAGTYIIEMVLDPVNGFTYTVTPN
jgi:hypothetical protein